MGEVGEEVDEMEVELRLERDENMMTRRERV